MRRFPVEKDGLVFILPTLAVSGLLFAFRFPGSGTVVLLLAAFIVYFFRDPEREIPQGERLILSPADGKVMTIKPFPDWKGPFGEPLMRISIFLSVFDVHVNRAPLTALAQEVTAPAKQSGPERKRPCGRGPIPPGERTPAGQAAPARPVRGR